MTGAVRCVVLNRYTYVYESFGPRRPPLHGKPLVIDRNSQSKTLTFQFFFVGKYAFYVNGVENLCVLVSKIKTNLVRLSSDRL